MIDVEVAYESKDKAYLLKLSILPNSIIEDAIIASGILIQCPEINLEINKVGVFSKLATLQKRLQPGDRVEIYRPLLIDPMQARIVRAKANPLSFRRHHRASGDDG